jgi:hypothetical protein
VRLLSSASNENPMNMGGWTAALANAETTSAIHLQTLSSDPLTERVAEPRTLGPEEGTRELPFHPLPYNAIDRVKEPTVEILRVYQRCTRSLSIRELTRAQADRHDYFRMSCGFPDPFTHSRMG